MRPDDRGRRSPRRAAHPSSSDFRHGLDGIEPEEPSDIKELPA
ncbi:hypothetical protein [Streptomyces litmocidini]|uniref:Uncharacterized protein n=1 Tax=Streptomyces litmocidini TaxID=67318 RepID=A0ABW7U5M4_9ACTN